MSARVSPWRRRLPILAAAALFAAGNVAFFLSYRANSQARREALEARRDALKASVSAGEAEAARLATQRERLTGVTDAIQEFYGTRIGSQRETLAAVVAELHRILRDAGVSTNQISYASQTVEKMPLTETAITFTIRTDYPRFKRLLRAFETSRRWFAVRNVSITRDAEQPGSVQVQLQAATYFSEKGPPPAAPRPPAPLETGKPAGSARGAVPARNAA